MCGFAGIVAWDDKYHVTRPLLEKMSARIAHRGPDGHGLYLNHEQEATPDRPQVGLVHRRLAILDPDPRSNQPFKDEAGRWLVFNGEIYNYRELRQELKSLRPDYEWRTNGDTEVLLLAYAVWGEKCVDHLNGMFAFAVWDEPKQQLFLARDRMGQKPLYYTLGGETGVAFASELGALKDLPTWSDDAALDDESLVDYLNLGYVPGDRTIYCGVRNLLPGTWIHGGQIKRHQKQYYRRTSSIVADPSARVTKSFVCRAVERQLVSDVPLGVFLSGGIDSSIIASCARSYGAVQTFSIGFDDPRYDESRYAQLIAKHLGTTHHEFRVRVDAANDLPELARVFGEPFGDSSALPTHYLARETRAHVKVALSGDGGDELFGGYERYRAIALTERVRATPAWLRRTLSTIGSAVPSRHLKSRTSKLKRLLSTIDLPPAERYASYVELFSYDQIDSLRGRHWFQEQWAGDHSALADVFASTARHDQLDAVRAAAALDRVTYLPGDLLTKVDRCSMLHALEVRSPFMDHELVHFAANLTTDQLLRGGPKRMLREAFAADLPAFVFKRKKMGFAVPIGEWFRGELRPMLRDHLFAANSFASQHFVRKTVERLVDEHETRRVDHSQRLYALLMLELWWRTARTSQP